MNTLLQCFSRSSLKGLARGSTSTSESLGGGSTTHGTSGSGVESPRDTGNPNSEPLSKHSWASFSKRKSGRTSQASFRPKTPPPSLSDEVFPQGGRPSLEPLLERTHSALNDLEAVQFLLQDLSHRNWRAANPTDQERLERLEQHELKPLVALGEGGFGSVNLCRVPVRPAAGGGVSAFASASHQDPASAAADPPAGPSVHFACDPASMDCTPSSPSRGAALSSKAADDGSGSGSSDPGSARQCAAELEVHPSLSEPQLIVAVKRVPLGWSQERELMQLHRCQDCPFIVRLFGFVEDSSGVHCSYIMEWAEGGDLGGLLSSLRQRRGPNKQRLLMAEDSARYYLACLLMALDFLHSNNMLHRDIKPSNLLLTSDGTAKLADLGFTVMLDANQQTVGSCGTSGYMAPEVWAYGTSKLYTGYGIPADMWSVGATLYQILTGVVPAEHHDAVLKKGWQPPMHPRFSPALQDLVNRLLAVKPQRRIQCVRDVVNHPWMAGFDWAGLRAGRLRAPYVPAEHRPPRKVKSEAAFKHGLSDSISMPRPALKHQATQPALGHQQQQQDADEEEAQRPTQQRGSTAAGPQRSALSGGGGDGSVRHGREGLKCSALSLDRDHGVLAGRAQQDGAAQMLRDPGQACPGGPSQSQDCSPLGDLHLPVAGCA